MRAPLSNSQLASVVGGATDFTKVDARGPGRAEKKVLKYCNKRLDYYTAAVRAYDETPANYDARKELAVITTGRALAICAARQGVEVRKWRYNRDD